MTPTPAAKAEKTINDPARTRSPQPVGPCESASDVYAVKHRNDRDEAHGGRPVAMASERNAPADRGTPEPAECGGGTIPCPGHASSGVVGFAPARGGSNGVPMREKTGGRARAGVIMKAERRNFPDQIVVDIPAAAPGKPRMTQRDKWKQRTCVVEYRAWADRLRAAFGEVPDPERVAGITVTACYAMPKSWSRKTRLAMRSRRKRTKPDGDNILKACTDPLWKRDEALGDQSVVRRWGDADMTTIIVELERKDTP